MKNLLDPLSELTDESLGIYVLRAAIIGAAVFMFIYLSTQ